jgi:hypothetical protein
MRHFGIHRGVCTTNSDPEGRGRVRALVPQILGDAETGWALPCFPPGWIHAESPLLDHEFTDDDTTGDSAREVLEHTLRQSLPVPGQVVWVMFEAGDMLKPVWIGVGS